jgi:hypothetical protein
MYEIQQNIVIIIAVGKEESVVKNLTTWRQNL